MAIAPKCTSSSCVLSSVLCLDVHALEVCKRQASENLYVVFQISVTVLKETTFSGFQSRSWLA